MVVCPGCGSSRIRDDYRPAPLILRVIGIKALLCDHCNRQFKAFSLRSSQNRLPRHASQKADVFNRAAAVDLNRLSEELQVSLTIDKSSDSAAELSQAGGQMEIQAFRSGLSGRSGLNPVESEPVDPAKPENGLRAKIDRIHQEGRQEGRQGGVFDAVEKAPVLSSFECPDCGSGDTRRRSRSSIDRAVFSMTEHRAYSCNSCGASFYAKADSEMGEGRVANSSGAV